MTDTLDPVKPRSVSRGRDYQSSGRGGLGNIRQPSLSREPTLHEEEVWASRGREPGQAVSTGRGGAGNIRSASRGGSPKDVLAEEEYEREVLMKRRELSQDAVRSSGRGGMGNISNSRSRSRGPATGLQALHSTGRGGAGNMKTGTLTRSDSVEEDERRLKLHVEGIHSTGRGGVANMSHSTTPELENPPNLPGEHLSTGRGGAGNVRGRSGSREASQRSPKDKHGITALWNKMTASHHGNHEKPSDAGVTEHH